MSISIQVDTVGGVKPAVQIMRDGENASKENIVVRYVDTLSTPAPAHGANVNAKIHFKDKVTIAMFSVMAIFHIFNAISYGNPEGDYARATWHLIFGAIASAVVYMTVYSSKFRSKF